ncbi:hypothetical protein DPMN_174877 [Dreissena polymorpha]|uniref:Uncharacterized protein n=1 Tax=Dreissena polymorpha TaxID=45954 RepID=A0A9D4E6T3_DREPO|nr:hypothetical protein DPMN_174877 [Dreissena polymorpha]
MQYDQRNSRPAYAIARSDAELRYPLLNHAWFCGLISGQGSSWPDCANSQAEPEKLLPK